MEYFGNGLKFIPIEIYHFNFLFGMGYFMEWVKAIFLLIFFFCLKIQLPQALACGQ